MKVCKKCGCNKFHGHQLVRMDVICTSQGFEENVHNDISQDIYDSEQPYGPFSCVDCGQEYEDLENLPDYDLLTKEDIEQALEKNWLQINKEDGEMVCRIGGELPCSI